jgi:phosphatidylserine decarboxylase
MIRFGSRTEVFLPLEAAASVSVGDHVKGGSSVIAHLPVGHPSAEQPKMKAVI